MTIQVRQSGSWKNLKTVSTTSASGGFSLRVNISKPGSQNFRAIAAARKVRQGRKTVTLRQATSQTVTVTGKCFYSNYDLIDITPYDGSSNPGLGEGSGGYSVDLPRAGSAYAIWDLKNRCRTASIVIRSYGHLRYSGDNASGTVEVYGDGNRLLDSRTVAADSTRELIVDISGQRFLQINLSDTSTDVDADRGHLMIVDDTTTLNCAF